MKAILLAISFSFLLLSPAIRADDACCESKGINVQEKLREIDLSILLKKYEQLQTEKARAEVQLILLQAATEQDDAEKIAAKNRVEVLHQYASEVRNEIVRLGKEVTVAAK